MPTIGARTRSARFKSPTMVPPPKLDADSCGHGYRRRLAIAEQAECVCVTAFHGTAKGVRDECATLNRRFFEPCGGCSDQKNRPHLAQVVEVVRHAAPYHRGDVVL